MFKENIALGIDVKYKNESSVSFNWFHHRTAAKTDLHYENTPIQTYRKIHLQKLKIYR